MKDFVARRIQNAIFANIVLFCGLREAFSSCASSQGAVVSRTVMAQLAYSRLSEREVSGSIFSDFNVCFDFPLIRVAIALNTCKMEH